MFLFKQLHHRNCCSNFIFRNLRTRPNTTATLKQNHRNWNMTQTKESQTQKRVPLELSCKLRRRTAVLSKVKYIYPTGKPSDTVSGSPYSCRYYWCKVTTEIINLLLSVSPFHMVCSFIWTKHSKITDQLFPETKQVHILPHKFSTSFCASASTPHPHNLHVSANWYFDICTLTIVMLKLSQTFHFHSSIFLQNIKKKLLFQNLEVAQ